jgi:protein gp37
VAADTKIEWCDCTWSPVWGCTQVSLAKSGGGGCDNCYAMTLAHRFGYGWNGEPMREFGEHHWNEPVRWNRRAIAEGRHLKVFPSMCDPFDKDWPPGLRARFLRLISATPGLTWLLLTKRIGNVERMLRAVRDEVDFDRERNFWLWLTEWYRECNAPPNVWLGATLVNREEMLRDGPKLKATPARVHFWSVEPMLGDLGEIPTDLMPDWVIAGGESGPHARPAHPDWFRSLRDQCAAAGVPFLLKQHGEWVGGETEASTERVGREIYVDDGYVIDLEDGRRYETTEAHGREFVRVGKKAAGRVLDGVQHDGFPA